MPSRQNTKRFTSEEVQGEGSYVIVRRPTFGEGKEARTLRTTIPLDGDTAAGEGTAEGAGDTPEVDSSTKFLRNRIVEWNWVDDAGTPLAQPKDDPAVLDQLTDNEIDFLIRKSTGKTEAELGNSAASS